MPGEIFVGHPWHHYAEGTSSAAPLLFFLVIAAMAALRRALHRGARRLERLVVHSSAPLRRPSAPPVVLASDEERAAACRVVAQAVSEGRIAIEEVDRRVEAVLRARHRHELAAATADLPALPAPAVPSPRRVVLGVLGAVVAAGALASLFAAAMLQAAFGIWQAWPIVVVLFGALVLWPRRHGSSERPAT